ncbi:MAG: hypothetical protein GY845_08585, partial [Planctomycetes bacterium]|nr:hypothetical protein [Planctomycetota bacterium]
MPAATLKSSQFQGQNPVQGSEKQSGLEIEFNKEGKQFRVKVGDTYFGWFANTPSNIKAVLVLLREMYDVETGKWVFTEEELAELLGSCNRQAVDGHMKGYRDADGDMLGFLKRKRKVDDEVVELVWKEFCADPYASLSDLTARANASYSGEKPLSEANVRAALSEISGYKVWREMLKGLEKGQSQYKEEYLLKHLLELLSEQADLAEPASLLPEGADVSEMQGSEAIGEKFAERISISDCFRDKVAPLFSKACDAASLKKEVFSAWEGPLGMLLLSFVLYHSGLSYATIGGWMGVDAST